MAEYMIKLTPMEPYFFGGERVFQFVTNSNKKDNNSDNGGAAEKYSEYYIISRDIPDQTTLLGTLRYVVLEKENKLKGSKDDKDDLVGDKSFSFSTGEPQHFGKIRSISPVMLLSEQESRMKFIVKNPFHNKFRETSGASEDINANGGREFKPIKMSDEKFITSESAYSIALPLEGEYIAKNGYGQGYYNLSDDKIVSWDKIFRTHELTGIDKNRSEEAYFKRQYCIMNRGYSFVFFADLDGEGYDDYNTICYMGQKRSAFKIEFKASDSINKSYQDVERSVREHFRASQNWYYALSDLILEEETDTANKNFFIAETKRIRNMENSLAKDGSVIRKRGSVQYNLITAGSVYYETPPCMDESYKTAGYNYCIKLN